MVSHPSLTISASVRVFLVFSSEPDLPRDVGRAGADGFTSPKRDCALCQSRAFQPASPTPRSPSDSAESHPT